VATARPHPPGRGSRAARHGCRSAAEVAHRRHRRQRRHDAGAHRRGRRRIERNVALGRRFRRPSHRSPRGRGGIATNGDARFPFCSLPQSTRYESAAPQMQASGEAPFTPLDTAARTTASIPRARKDVLIGDVVGHKFPPELARAGWSRPLRLASSGSADRRERLCKAKNRRCGRRRRCRRRDSNPRHADYDSRLIWLSHREFRAGWTRRWTQRHGQAYSVPRVRTRCAQDRRAPTRDLATHGDGCQVGSVRPTRGVRLCLEALLGSRVAV
jgi:hypothetical protein